MMIARDMIDVKKYKHLKPVDNNYYKRIDKCWLHDPNLTDIKGNTVAMLLARNNKIAPID